MRRGGYYPPAYYKNNELVSTVNTLPQRKKIRLEGYDYSSAGCYFVTVCVKNPEDFLWKRVGANTICPNYEFIEELPLPLTTNGKIVEQAINNIPTFYKNVVVEKYCIMPNHIHILLLFLPDENGRILSAPTLSTVIGQMKRWVSKQVGKPIWQKSYVDRIIDSEKAYEAVWQYIDNNPRKWHLDKTKYKGETK